MCCFDVDLDWCYSHWQTARRCLRVMSHLRLCPSQIAYTAFVASGFWWTRPTSAMTPLSQWMLDDPMTNIRQSHLVFWDIDGSLVILLFTAYSSCNLHWLNIWLIESFTLMMFSLLSIEARSLYTIWMTKPNPNEFLRFWIGPMQRIVPSTIIAKRLHKYSHSSMLFEEGEQENDLKFQFLIIFGGLQKSMGFWAKTVDSTTKKSLGLTCVKLTQCFCCFFGNPECNSTWSAGWLDQRPSLARPTGLTAAQQSENWAKRLFNFYNLFFNVLRQVSAHFYW